MGKAYGKTWKQWKNLVTMIQWISLRGKLQETLKPLYIFYIYILDGIWMGKTMISCRFSHQPIQWMMFKPGNVIRINCISG
jgi:hypothetical protein